MIFSNIRPFCLFRTTITTNFYSLNAAALSAPLTINLNVFIKMSLQPTKTCAPSWLHLLIICQDFEGFSCVVSEYVRQIPGVKEIKKRSYNRPEGCSVLFFSAVGEQRKSAHHPRCMLLCFLPLGQYSSSEPGCCTCTAPAEWMIWGCSFIIHALSSSENKFFGEHLDWCLGISIWTTNYSTLTLKSAFQQSLHLLGPLLLIVH